MIRSPFDTVMQASRPTLGLLWDSLDNEEVDQDFDVEQVKLPTSQTVYLLTSPLGFTAPATTFGKFKFGLVLFKFLIGVNTTHWGLMINKKCYDLKRHGNPLFAETSFEASELATRKERETLQEIPLGKTHFTDLEVVMIGMKLLRKNTNRRKD